jgi:O-antigen/teichoic acid export membrane protein
LNTNNQIPTAQKVTSAVSWSFTGKALFILLKFLESVFLVRLLGSEQFGIYGSLINFLGIAALLLSLGFDSVLNKYGPILTMKGKFNDLRTILRIAFITRFVVYLPLAAVILLDPHWCGTTLFHQAIPEAYFACILIVLAFMLFYSLFRILIDSTFHLRYLTTSDVIAQILFLGAASLSILWGTGLLGVLYAYVFAEAVLFILFFLKFYSILLKMPKDGPHDSFHAKPLLNYGFTMYMYSLLTFLLGKGLDILLLGILLGDMTQIAYYIIGFNLAWYSTGFLDMTISGSYIMSLIVESYEQKNETNLKQIYSGLFEVNYIFIIPVVLGGILLRNDIIHVLYSTNNMGAVPYFLFFLMTLGIGRYTGITQTFLVIVGGEKKLLLSRSLIAVVNILFALILIPRFGAMGMAFATGLAMIFSVVYESYLLHQRIHLPNIFVFLRKTILASLSMMILLALEYQLVPRPSLFSLLLFILTAMIFYGAFLFYFKPISRENIDFLVRGNQKFGWFLQRLM